MLLNLLLLLPTLLPVNSPADPLPAECLSPHVKSIELPVSPERPSTTFTLRYELRSGNPILPTIVFVPSGPGQKNIFPDRNDFTQAYFLPAGYPVLNLEYRGTGCSIGAQKQMMPEDYRLVRAADDFIEIIRQQGIKRYFVLGVGNGSAVARILTSRARKAGIPEPQSLVLAGAVGRAWKKRERFKQGAVEEWEKLKTEMSPEQLTLANSKSVWIGGYSKKAWGNFIVNSIWPGWMHPPNEVKRHPLLDSMQAVLNHDIDGIHQLAAQLRYAERDPRVFASDTLFSRMTLCQELSESDDEEVELVNGKLQLTGHTKFCKGLTLSHPFHAEDWPIGVNQYLIQGRRDPFVREWQVTALLEASQNVNTSVLWSTESGHGTPVFSLSLCRERLWELIFDHRILTQEALEVCQIPLSIDYQQQK